MHQDQRIGLALGILLLGAAGAFFFRNDPKPAAPSQRLKSARILDARIDEMQNSPYSSKMDEDQASPATKSTPKLGSQNRNSESKKNRSGSDKDFPKLEETNPWGSLVQNGELDGHWAERPVAHIPVPSPADDSNSPKAAVPTPKLAATDSDRIYVIQRGDTLSSIAAKELGNSSRFSEIFEANRGVLNDANDLKVGGTLRIPVKKPSRSEASPNGRAARPNISAPPLLPSESGAPINADSPVSNGSSEQSSMERTVEEPSPKKRFEPAGRPFTTNQGQANPPGDSPTRPIRKLSQLPPKETGGKVAR